MAWFPLAAQSSGSVAAQCPTVKIQAERLADLNNPRTGHVLISVNGEPTVIGGHTNNYVPTATIEYYRDGKWHIVPSAFTHDNGFAVELSTGKVLIGGGHERNLGIGQSFEVELYDPLTHTCEGFSSLDTKRALASAMALDDGAALITGNWHHDDAIEMYDGKGGFHPVKGVSCGRANPYILRTAKDDAIIFSSLDSTAAFTPCPVIDRLHGESYREPLLEEWGLLNEYEHMPSAAFIGDEAKGDYSYLLMVENEAGQAAIARVTNGEFSLLPTDAPIPMSYRWGGIAYGALIFANRQHRRAYLLGTDTLQYHKPQDTGHIYIVAIDYAQVPAHLTFGYTDVLQGLDIRKAVMTPDGDLILAGGIPAENNFKPTAATWLLHVSPHAQAAKTGLPWWAWTLISLVLAALATWLMLFARHRKKHPTLETPAVKPLEENHVITDNSEGEEDAQLMRRICQLMEEQQLYLNPDLKVTDVADALGTTRVAVSNCIRSQRGCTFPQLVNTYRVALAQQLLNSQPDIKLTEVWTAAGFSSESSFYRIFKALTGTTPTDWRSNN